MYKYEMDSGSIMEDTDRARFGLQTDGQSETSIPLLNFVGGGIMIWAIAITQFQLNAWKIARNGILTCEPNQMDTSIMLVVARRKTYAYRSGST